jgi:hypothetical protein
MNFWSSSLSSALIEHDKPVEFSMLSAPAFPVRPHKQGPLAQTPEHVCTPAGASASTATQGTVSSPFAAAAMLARVRVDEEDEEFFER